MTRSRDDMRTILRTDELFPCEGKQAMASHLSAYEISDVWAERIAAMTEVCSSCRWLCCPAYKMCDLRWFGGDHPIERSRSENLLLEMASDLPTSAILEIYDYSEMSFLEEMLSSFENNSQFIPSKRQEYWIESLHKKWVEHNEK